MWSPANFAKRAVKNIPFSKEITLNGAFSFLFEDFANVVLFLLLLLVFFFRLKSKVH